ncbi:MAG: alpha/beta hydrolase family protein [Gemmatimonadales bacterium]
MLVLSPSAPRLGLVLAHGAGAGMRHPFLETIAGLLADRSVATLRYEFPYMEQGKSRTDSPAVCAARVREAVARARAEWPALPLLAGGKSFGGRMTSIAQAEKPLDGVIGLAFLGFPLHAPGKPSVSRADQLFQIEIPMLFLQGSRDEFAQPDLLADVTERLGPLATVHPVDGGDHSFKVPKKSGTAGAVMAGLADRIASWGSSLAARS